MLRTIRRGVSWASVGDSAELFAPRKRLLSIVVLADRVQLVSTARVQQPLTARVRSPSRIVS